jgi:hypothetical protein
MAFGISRNITVRFAPTLMDVQEANLIINTSGGVHTIALSGTGADPNIYTFPHFEGFENVPVGGLPPGWRRVTVGSSTGRQVRAWNIGARDPLNDAKYWPPEPMCLEIAKGNTVIEANFPIAASPIINNINQATVSFYAARGWPVGAAALQVGTLNDENVFQQIGEDILISTLGDDENYTPLFVDLATATGNRFALRVAGSATGNSVVWLDYFTFNGPNFQPPTNLQITIGYMAIRLNWGVPADRNIIGYNVYRNGEKIAGPLLTTVFTDTDVELFEQYQYQVTAIFPDGESPPSNLAVIRTDEALEEADPFENDQLSVTLSAFNATFIAESDHVVVQWTTESETNLRGFNVHKNTVNDISTSMPLTGTLIDPKNTTTTQHYRVEDKEITPGTEYFYWLEVYNNDGTIRSLGMRNVLVPEEVDVLPLPEITSIANVFPNPIRANTSANFDVEVKENEVAVLKIFNIRGQLVYERNDIKQGRHRIQWDGRDRNNREVGSGVYFYRLTSPSHHSVQRMVIIK